MTGSAQHPGGFPLTHFDADYRGDDWRMVPLFTLATGPMTLGAVLLHTESGTTRAKTRIW